MDEERIPVSMDEFNRPIFLEKRKRMEDEGYIYDRSLSGCGTAATYSTAGGKLPDVIILAGYFVKKQQ